MLSRTELILEGFRRDWKSSGSKLIRKNGSQHDREFLEIFIRLNDCNIKVRFLSNFCGSINNNINFFSKAFSKL